MTGAGYAKDGSGIWAKGGKEVSFAIEDPTAYTDYYQSAQIMCADLKTVGFACKVAGVDPNKWYADLAAGTFDTAIHWGTTGPSPYAQYDGWLDPELAKGNNATGNYGRFSDDAATKALADYAKAGTEEESKAAIGTLAKVHVRPGPGRADHVRRRLVRVQHQELRRLGGQGQPVRRPVAEPVERGVRDPAPHTEQLSSPGVPIGRGWPVGAPALV